MKMKPVKSSNITHIGHAGDTMHVTYKGGATYRFSGVSADQFNELMAADSKGSHLHKMGIKGVKI